MRREIRLAETFFENLEKHFEKFKEIQRSSEDKKKSFLLHPCLKEYIRWVNDMPLWYTNPKETPLFLTEGFEHLCFTFGKNMERANQRHEGFSEEGKKSVMDIVNRFNHIQPGSIQKVVL